MFQQFAAVDWSGAKTPFKTFAVSLAVCDDQAGSAPQAVNKKLSRTDVFEWIAKQVKHGHKTLLGIDCNLGYSAKVAQQQVGPQANYLAFWQALDQVCSDDDNFFAGKFWQHKRYGKAFWVSGKQPEWFDLQTLRRKSEQASVDKGLGTPESPFKLIGAKQVGKGGLAGMRMMYRLKREFGDRIAVWPFEANLVDDAIVVISENFPRLFIRHAGFGNKKVREVDELERVLSYFSAECPIFQNVDGSNTGEKDQVALNDHLTDAIIASAGMRWAITSGYSLDTQRLPVEAKKIEGWIFGV